MKMLLKIGIAISTGYQWNKNSITVHLNRLSILAYPSHEMMVVQGRQTAEPMYFLAEGRDTKYNISFAVDGTDELRKRYYNFLSFNSARAVNSVGTFLVILCASVAQSFF